MFGRDVFDKKLLIQTGLSKWNWLWLAGGNPSHAYFSYTIARRQVQSLVETKTARFIKFCSELKHLPYEPHLAPLSVQKESKCLIGQDYPVPMVEGSSGQENIKFRRASVGQLEHDPQHRVFRPPCLL